MKVSDWHQAQVIQRRLDHLSHALSSAPDGSVLEFGVYQGESLSHLAAYSKDRPVFGFDSFEGLPDPWHRGSSIYQAGHFAVNGPPDVEGAIVIEGWFNETLPRWLEMHDDKVALVHIDSDLYASAALILSLLDERLVDGSIIVFDELCQWWDTDLPGSYPNWKEGEWRALVEFASVRACTPFSRTRGQAGAVKVV